MTYSKMALQNDFANALQLEKNYEDSFKPLYDHLKELNEVISSNFSQTTEKTFWKKSVKVPIKFNIESKGESKGILWITICSRIGNYLLRIKNNEISYCSSHCFTNKDKQLFYIIPAFMSIEHHFYEEDFMNPVQFFSHLIRQYKEYLNEQP